MKKYDPLTKHLKGLSGDEWRPTFGELEAVLGFPLPKLAHTSGAFWANEGLRPHNLAWLDAGWKVGEVDRKGGTVVFKRTPAPRAPIAVPDEAVAEAISKQKARLGAAALMAGSAALVAGIGALAFKALRGRKKTA